MMFNVGKCKVVHFGRSNPRANYFMKNHKLISSDLKASQQCHQVCAKASKSLGMISRTITSKCTRIILQQYKSVVRPLLE